jgi:hypothetical protein
VFFCLLLKSWEHGTKQEFRNKSAGMFQIALTLFCICFIPLPASLSPSKYLIKKCCNWKQLQYSTVSQVNITHKQDIAGDLKKKIKTISELCFNDLIAKWSFLFVPQVSI